MERDTKLTQATAIPEASRGPARGSVLLGKYRVEDSLGFGATGIVVKAYNAALQEWVAIKVWRDDVELDAQAVARFVREAQAAFTLKSEHVARIRDVGVLDDGKPYIVMELLEGHDLGRILVEQGRLDPRRAVDLILQACDALAEAHANGIVHRDIKPTNLFVGWHRDGSELLKVLDFGISKAPPGPEMALTQTSSLLGTPAYMSPEQMRSARTVDPRTDIWALGAVLYELVEGRQPYDARNFAMLCIQVATGSPRAMTVAPELSAVIGRCLARELDGRFQNVAELADALAPLTTKPLHAKDHVIRIHRVLGLTPPVRDATPIPRRGHEATPTPRPGSPAFEPVPSTIKGWATPVPTVRPAPAPQAGPRPPRTWLVILIAFLFALGVAVGLVGAGVFQI